MTRKEKTEREKEKESGMWICLFYSIVIYSTIQVFFFDSIEMVALSQWNPLLIRKKRCYQIYFLLNTYINLFKKKNKDSGYQ